MSRANIYTQVRKALPDARRVLRHGLDSLEVTECIRGTEPQNLTDAQLTQLTRWTDATFELGIAVGLLRADAVLGTGGGK